MSNPRTFTQQVPTIRVLDDVLAERDRQEAKWGEQNHPSVDPVLTGRDGGCTPERMAEEFEIPTANRARFVCDLRHRRGDGTWADIALEEFCEAIEAGTIHGQMSTELRTELVQTAAVLVAWIECIDRGGALWQPENEAKYLGKSMMVKP